MAKQRKIENSNDEDVAFFNSLLPTVKKLSDRDKFIFRMKVQNALFDLAFPQSDPPVPHPKTITSLISPINQEQSSIQQHSNLQPESDTYSILDLP